MRKRGKRAIGIEMKKKIVNHNGHTPHTQTHNFKHTKNKNENKTTIIWKIFFILPIINMSYIHLHDVKSFTIISKSHQITTYEFIFFFCFSITTITLAKEKKNHIIVRISHWDLGHEKNQFNSIGSIYVRFVCIKKCYFAFSSVSMESLWFLWVCVKKKKSATRKLKSIRHITIARNQIE